MRKNALGTEPREEQEDQKVGGEMRLKEGPWREQLKLRGILVVLGKLSAMETS